MSDDCLTTELDIQDAWSGDPLQEKWWRTFDHGFLLDRAMRATVDVTTWGASGKLLDVAAAEGEVTCRLHQAFTSMVVLEPSAMMLARARDRMRESGVHFERIRGIGEALPFSDETFDRVLCHSAIDHFADPERGIREMARVTKPDGRLILTFVNYGSLTARAARALYAVGRRTGLVPPSSESCHFAWDSPVPAEHNFECTWVNVSSMCEAYLELDWARGVSLGWGFPGWGQLVDRIPTLERVVERLNRFVLPRPALADFVVTMWRPRPRTMWPVDDYRVRPTNPVYQHWIRSEANYWGQADFGLFFGAVASAAASARNADLTGDAARSWLDDLVARGPFRDVAVLGCDDARWDAEWLRRNASPRLDIYELSPVVSAKVKQRLGDVADRVRFIEADLNFAELPAGAYDCIWASATLHCLVNLEHVFNQIQRALRPGGLFAFCGWVGENRLQYGAQRLALVNALLARVPPAYRKIDVVERPSMGFSQSPFMAIRSQDILALARSHADFEVLHDATGGWSFPLMLVIDVDGLARDRADVVDELRAAELAARSDPELCPTLAYVVLRKR